MYGWLDCLHSSYRNQATKVPGALNGGEDRLNVKLSFRFEPGSKQARTCVLSYVNYCTSFSFQTLTKLNL